MQISITTKSLQEWSGAVLLVGVLEEELQNQLKQIGLDCDHEIEQKLKINNFNAKREETTTLQLFSEKNEKLILVGLGTKKDLSLNYLRKAIANAIRGCISFNGSLGIFIPWEELNSAVTAEEIAIAARLSLYKDETYRSKPEPRSLPTKIQLIGISKETNYSEINVSSVCEGVELARELVNAPANHLTPSKLADIATNITQGSKLDLKILDKEACIELGMGAYIAVSQGSDLDPKFIHLTFRPQGEIKKRIAIIGKGLTFDSGGYNLKVGAAQIDLMKFDMGGSAAVLGAAKAISKIEPNSIEVHFIVASCENMINGSAIHPGDIVKASNGMTIEINNTDAEGRLTLADALVYACKLKPDALVDLATLTGACVIALGDEMAGLWSNNDQLAKKLKNSADTVGEGLWRMPLQKTYREGLKSLLADIKNTGPRAGGSITAALFLEEFIDKSIPWAHIDIAGTVWSEKDKGLNAAGATGYGVRSLVNWICKLNEE